MPVRSPFLVALASSGAFLLGCAGGGVAPGAPPGLPRSAPPEAGWRLFEDRYLRARIPGDWEAERSAESPGISTTWRIAPPEARRELLLWGVVTVTMYEDGREKRPLKALFKEAASRGPKPAGKPRQARLGSGDCLAYRTESPAPPCGAPEGFAGKPGACVESWLEMRCHGRAGRYFEVRSGMGRHPAGKPDGAALERLRRADRILTGLEFR